jgi:signal transduction histidine kinase/ligand-binding sensor domain-containing protein/DNA-binding response OmpR family regulator
MSKNLSLKYLSVIILISLSWNRAISQGNTSSFEHFSQEDGLSNNQIHCAFQDKRGFMWFGTSQGVSRFDGYRFTRFVNNPADTSSLRGNLVRVIFESSGGELYVGTENGGLNLYNRDLEIFSHLFDRFDNLYLQNTSVNDIREDNQGRLWIATDDGLLLVKNKKDLVRVIPDESRNARQFAHNFIRVITFDPFGNLWMGTNRGVFVLDTARNRVRPFDLPVPESLNEEVWELTTDPDGKIWIGTYDNGIFIIHGTGEIEKHFFPNPGNNRSRTVRSIVRDPKGNYWIGTRGGLYIYNNKEGIISSYSHDEREASSLSGNSVLDIFHDSRGDTWIGTRTGINYLIHSKQHFRNFRAMPGDKRYMNSSEVWAFWLDSKRKIWVGTEDGGVNIYNPDTQTFSYLVHQSGNPGTLSSNCIKSFMDDGTGNLWIATFGGGINKLNLQTGKITHFRNNPDISGTLSDDRVWSLLKDSRDKIWVTTSSGVDYFDAESGTFHRLKEIPDNTQVNWIGEDQSGDLWMGGRDELYIFDPLNNHLRQYPEYTRAFLEDAKGRIWIATLNKGLALYSKEKGAIRYFGEKEGITNNQTLSILEDNNHFLWIGTTNGLSRFNPETGYFQTFSGKDGLQNSQFNYGAAFKLPSGELIMGGISGFNIFNPLQVAGNEFNAPIVITELRILNKRAEPGNDRNSILRKSITETKEITLPFDKKAITIEFAALNFFNSPNNLYSYYLEGFDDGWTDPSTVRTATYTNLNPGDYTFRVKSVIHGVPDTRNDIFLKITILPPFYRTVIFKLMLFLFISGLFYALILFLLNREKLKNELVFERLRAKKLHEFDMLKLRFFTNISHEIRTPLTLILGPIEKLRNKQAPDSQVQSLLEIMYRNARQLNLLINQILDFRKLETGNLKLELTDGELVSYIRGIKEQFDYQAKEKEIEYNFNSLADKVLCRFDPDKIEKIISNLLSNAFKFTDKGGKIHINLSLVFESKENIPFDQDTDAGNIEISVKDSGRGISSVHIDKIFNRFFQSGEKTELPGTGIGLALVKELVKLHNGNIFVTSKPGQGSKFTVRLPLIETFTDHQETTTIEIPESVAHSSAHTENQENFQERIMLIVEDNADVRLFIHHHFDPMFTILDAADGIQGWEVALKTVPDIILCDILMPRLDGYELLKRLKNDERTSHIPVIMITALVSKEHEMEGLTAGADDYITKPFDLMILQTKIENIFSIRQSLKDKYSSEILLQPKNILISPPDERFLKKAIEIVEHFISDPDLNIEKFAVEAGVSRMQLYRKLNALTDMTVKEFVRDIRLKRAAQLLCQNTQNVSEIAYSVGFRDLSHFRKCFKQKFGMSATEYAEGRRDEETEGLRD